MTPDPFRRSKAHFERSRWNQFLVALATTCFCINVEAAQPASDRPAQPSTLGSVLWPLPVVAPPVPQTEAERERGRKEGRPAPLPEVLQPTLDDRLQAYARVPADQVSGSYRGASSDVLVGLVDAWLRRFQELYPAAKLTIAPPYAGSLGTKELIKDALDFVFVSRELKPEDIAEFRERFGYPPSSFPVGGGSYRHYGFLDAIGFVVHPSNPLESISFEQIDAIYSSTRHRGGAAVTTWGQLGLGGEWASRPIVAYGVKPWNGFEEFVRQRVLSRGDSRGEWRDDVRMEPLIFPVTKSVASNRDAIGYTGLAYLDSPVKVLRIRAEEQETAVAPAYENVALARYPLARLTYLTVNRKPGQALPVPLRELMHFILSRDGQAIVREHGIFLPLRAEQVRQSRELLGER